MSGMRRFSGKGVCGDIAIGKISVFRRQNVPVSRRHVEDTAAEWARFEAAKAAAHEELAAVYEKALREVGESGGRSPPGARGPSPRR